MKPERIQREIAERPAGGRHGLQLWTGLPPAMKFAEPDQASFRAVDIPGLHLPGARVRVFAGPFVMDTPEHAVRAQRDFLDGKMGTLDGVPF